MGAMSLRLPDDLVARLDTEVKLDGRVRSEVVRTALAEYLLRRERERFMAEYVAETRAAYQDPAIQREALEIAEDFLPLENEALDRAEGRRPGEPWPQELGERWWV
jgi:metal-responsive CopG/Arc/MetJ family transcriptional regulator